DYAERAPGGRAQTRLRLAGGSRSRGDRSGRRDFLFREEADRRRVASRRDHGAARSAVGAAREDAGMRLLLLAAFAAASALMVAAAQPKPRARDLGVAPGVYPPGALNAITDVAGVRVGQTTIVTGDDVRTGVTAIVPHGGNVFQDKVAGAVFVGNAFGKLAGSTQVNELGTIETPIVLTNTLSVGVA